MAALDSALPIKTNTSGLTADRLSEVFNRNFLKHAIDKLVLADVCEKFDLPQHAGTTQMRFFRRNEANVDNVRALTEGTPLTMYTYSQLETVDVILSQFGDVAKISDTRVMTDLIKQLELETARMGEEAALHLDTQIRDELHSALLAQHVATGPHNDGASEYFINKASSTPAKRMLTVADLDIAATLLFEHRAPTFEGGCYIAVVSPRQAYQLRTDSTWKNVATYSDREKIYKGEIGKIFNVKVIVATNPKVTTDANIDFTGDGDVLDTVDNLPETAHNIAAWETAFVLGREAVGTIKLAGTNSPLAPRLIYNDKPDKSDPLNQFQMVGWKAWYASKTLNPKFAVGIRTEQASLV